MSDSTETRLAVHEAICTERMKFISDSLTKETVLGWIWANGVDKAAVEASLEAQIAEQKAPVKATGVPWNV